MDSEFFSGFLSGIIAAGLLGFTAQQARLARKNVTAFDSPQKVAHSTDKTPFQIFWGCLVGSVFYVIWTIALLALLLGLVWMLANGLAQ